MRKGKKDGGGLNFAPMQQGDIPQLAALDADAPDPWTADQLGQELYHLQSHTFVAFADGDPVGFACFSLPDETAVLQTVAVATALRGQGIGEALLRFSLQRLQGLGAQRCVLEVRCGNRRAKALYRKLGFCSIALRRGLFSCPREDGETMALTL